MFSGGQWVRGNILNNVTLSVGKYPKAGPGNKPCAEVPPGKYSVTVDCPGHTPVTGFVDASGPGVNVTLDDPLWDLKKK